ncbi:hypothetical protein CFC21_086318 [Triticum aestivum]|uniref:PTM/DIR17-like Tudor domain-containing protein n=2 Tax=Triticum aestivum TaxID=4565 RepID=A0A3B6PH47_WHEAT|nr:uncharacterized protein LOC123135619 [Triticum aestivum]XP_044410705.1 uncharacterized protein LOC123135619 [Triticum aestivum]KAF7082446.1 hypothetical protein CFC21_086318 [Triticum aestivum]
MFLAKSKEVMQYQVMEGRKDMQESDAAPVVQVPREPAIVINGVPNFPPDFASGSQLAVRDAPRSRVDHRFGEWLVERKVRKWFGDKYYAGNVVWYDSVNNWYTVVYEDGDQEDLEWHELEEILLPLDITIPLNTLVMDKFRHQNLAPDYRTYVASNQMVVRAVHGQQSNNPPLPGWLQASASAGENALVCLKPSDQPKKRGRPRKDRSTSGDIQPVPKTTGDIQPKKRGRPPKEPGEKSIDRRKLETVRAEKLKRESMLLRGPPPGSQSF